MPSFHLKMIKKKFSDRPGVLETDPGDGKPT